MPLRLDAIFPEGISQSDYRAMIQDIMDYQKSYSMPCVLENEGEGFHTFADLVDIKTGKVIGDWVMSVLSGEQLGGSRVIDACMLFRQKTGIMPLRRSRSFVVTRDLLQDHGRKIKGVKHIIPYCEAEDPSTGARFHVEIATPLLNDSPLLESRCRMKFSLFPFEASVFDDIDELNRFLGFGDGIAVGGTSLRVSGLSEKTVFPGNTFGKTEAVDEPYTTLVGKVVSFRDVRIRIAGKERDLVLAWIDTALGLVPTALSRTYFDLSALAAGKVVMMNAFIAADTSKPGDFRRIGQYPM